MRQKQHETYLHPISGKFYFQFRHISCYANSMQIGGKPVQKENIGKKNEVVSLLKCLRQRVNKIIIFLTQKFQYWQPRSSSSSFEAGFHVIVLVVSITRVVTKCVQAIKAFIWKRLKRMGDDTGDGPFAA